MKKTIFVTALLSASFGFAQSVEDKQKISESYDANLVKEVQGVVERAENIRAAKVEQYLKDNPTALKTFYKEEVKFDLQDIVEGKPIYTSTDNATCAVASKTTALYPGGSLGLSLEGQNMTVGVWDGGYIRKAHVEFMNDATPAVSRVSFPDTPNPNPTTELHGTHVGGTVGAKGVNASAKGMAPKATILSYNWTNDDSEVTTAAAGGLLISNHSYGVPILNDAGEVNVPSWMPGCYDSNARESDLISFAAPYYLRVASAGNSGGDSYTGGMKAGYDKLTTDKNAKNNLVIANGNPVVNAVTGNIVNMIINASSSQGPADDGRIKPDLTTKGTNVFSTNNSANNTYATLTGTSMASPNAAGSLILLQEHYHNVNQSYMKAATLKGLVCHTAQDDTQKIGPDAKFGWGFLNARESAETITKNGAGTALVLESELMQGGTYTTTFSVTDPANLKATICWTDPAGTDRSGQLNSAVPVLVNDLDLRISSGTETYLPWKLQLSDVSLAAIKGDNTVDTVERVDVSGATAGTFTLTVSHKGTLTNGSQAFSLILTGTGLALSTKENEFKDVKIWPNPTTDRLYFQLGSGVNVDSVKVYDISGKQMNLTVNHDFVDVSNLQQGVYILKLETGSSSNAYKFVKK